MIQCDRCGNPTPPMRFCVQCGNGLAGAPPAHGIRSEFAAAPHEHLLGLHLASTLFPQLPRADMESFRLALGIAAVAMVGLAAVGLYPAALAVSAVAVPALMAIYLHDVDVYEDEPMLVVGATMLWGAAAGIVVTLLSRAAQSSTASVGSSTGPTDLLTAGFGLPLIQLALMAVGPLALLRNRKFNDVLDGAIFGASSAVSFLGARALIVALDFTRAGVAPPGETLPRIVVLLTFGIALPVLAASVSGAAMGSVWLRWRSSLRGASSLGVFGNPLVAGAAAAVIYVLASLALLVLPGLAALLVIAVLGAIALVWLRVVIHVGLLQELSERPIGPPIRCANCRRMTPHHTFCGECGVSLRALPKGTRRGDPRDTSGAMGVTDAGAAREVSDG